MEKIVKSKIRCSTIIIVVIVLAVILGIWYLIFGKNGLFKLQQNIYFMEWDNKEDETSFYRYSPKDDKVVEFGKIEGKLYHCAVNKEETCLTGARDNGKFLELIRYDLNTGTVQIENIDEKTDSVTGGWDSWNTLLLYDGGNRILIAYDDKNGEEQRLKRKRKKDWQYLWHRMYISNWEEQ